MNKTHFLYLRIAWVCVCWGGVTEVENWRNPSNSKQLVHGRITGLGQGYFQ